MIYIYRYLYEVAGKDSIFVKVISGIEAEHAEFIKRVTEAEEVTKCSRVYMGEYDPSKLEDYENIKSEDKTK